MNDTDIRLAETRALIKDADENGFDWADYEAPDCNCDGFCASCEHPKNPRDTDFFPHAKWLLDQLEQAHATAECLACPSDCHECAGRDCECYEHQDLHPEHLTAETNRLRAERDEARRDQAAACNMSMDADEAIQRVRDLHHEALILDECNHSHPWADVEAGTAYVDEEIGVTCKVLYRVCRECCIVNGEQSEDCANGHRWHHGPDGYRCKTLRALEVTDA